MNDAPVQRGFEIRALGEVAIRCAELGPMIGFYRDVLGLTVLEGSEAEGIVFFDLGPGHGGHRTVLALFHHAVGRADLHARQGPPATGGRSSLHHIALTLGAGEQQAAMDWYDAQGIGYQVQEFDWIGWRGVFTSDPEGNTVELVAKIREGTRA